MSGRAPRSDTGSAPRFREAAALAFVCVVIGAPACLSDVALPACLEQGVSCAGAPAASGAAENGGAGDSLRARGGMIQESARDKTLLSVPVGGGEPSGGSSGSAGDLDRGGEAGAAGGGSLPCRSCIISPEALPAPCGASRAAFQTKLSVLNGVAPFLWRVVRPTESWSIPLDPAAPNGARAVLTGRPVGTDSVTVEVTDHTGAVAQKTYPILPRDACWFAYTENDASGAHLQLLDPILGLPAPIQLSHDLGVYDFQFSPNGRYLVYRYGADETQPHGKHLALVNLATWTEAGLDFAEQSVGAMSWSPDSTVLAVAFATADKSYLGGVKLAASGATTELVPVEARIDSDLYWVGGSYLAFTDTILLSQSDPTIELPNPALQRTPFYAALGSAGFTAPVPFPNVTYGAEAAVQPSDAGFFMISATDSTNFYPLPGTRANRHDPVDLVSPSGHFTALLSPDDDGQLQLFAAALGNVVAPPQYTSENPDDCPKLLAWAKDKERIACVANVEHDSAGMKHGEVRIFDAQNDSDTLAMSPLPGFCEKNDPELPIQSTCATSEYEYTVEKSNVEARAFSASGQWFAFTTSSPDQEGDNYLYWADLRSPDFELKGKAYYAISGQSSTSPTALAFSADENYLLFQRGELLIAQDVRASGDQASATLAQPVDGFGACSEDFPSAPDRWCGKADRKLPFLWAPDPRYAAYRSTGKLIVADFTLFPSATTYVLDAADCDRACDNQFAFQPRP